MGLSSTVRPVAGSPLSLETTPFNDVQDSTGRICTLTADPVNSPLLCSSILLIASFDAKNSAQTQNATKPQMPSTSTTLRIGERRQGPGTSPAARRISGSTAGRIGARLFTTVDDMADTHW